MFFPLGTAGKTFSQANLIFVFGTLCITVMFPKFQMPDGILESCTLSYYSRIYDAKGADRMPTLVQSDQCSVALLVCVHNVCT